MAMQQGGKARPPDPRARASFETDYRIFLQMHEQRRALDRIASGTDAARPPASAALPRA